MEKIKVQEVIIVEGKYDLNAIKQVVDGIVLTTEGFGIFRNQEKMELIRKMAETRGVVVLTDSDGAGFVIRNYLKGCVSTGTIKHAYIPDVYGKERRKRTKSKEGKLGVEGMSPEVLRKVLTSAGATIDGKVSKPFGGITKTDLFVLGLSGGSNSAEQRGKLMRALQLPEHLSPNALLDVLNSLFSRETFLAEWNKIKQDI